MYILKHDQNIKDMKYTLYYSIVQLTFPVTHVDSSLWWVMSADTIHHTRWCNPSSTFTKISMRVQYIMSVCLFSKSPSAVVLSIISYFSYISATQLQVFWVKAELSKSPCFCNTLLAAATFIFNSLWHYKTTPTLTPVWYRFLSVSASGWRYIFKLRQGRSLLTIMIIIMIMYPYHEALYLFHASNPFLKRTDS